MRRIALIGGSFDPIHNGHLILAEYAKAELNLDTIIFVPCNKSAYRDKLIQAKSIDRLAMLMSINKQGKYIISSCELLRGKTSYTIDTVKFFTNLFKNDNLVLIAGKDSQIKFSSWKDAEEIPKYVDIKFATKDFYVPQIGINSTLIRNLVKEGKSIKYLVPESVEDYIIKHKLYR